MACWSAVDAMSTLATGSLTCRNAWHEVASPRRVIATLMPPGACVRVRVLRKTCLEAIRRAAFEPVQRHPRDTTYSAPDGSCSRRARPDTRTAWRASAARSDDSPLQRCSLLRARVIAV